ncbi:MAG: cysteine--tRNA ligase [Bdellovibrionaceae bacterium]|nr:cysteine--tRNA ligase [Pseudobdellovibrionaceae bacterium]
MELKIYNTLTRTKEVFQPMNAPHVRMYVCGPTVYDFLHVGNFRGPVVFNMIRNYLELLGYKVTFALNFTDIDDKIIKRANEMGVTANELSEKYIAEYKKDFQILGLRAHDLNPKVTEHLPAINEMISTLVDNGTAYVVDGDVWYSIEKFKEYGKLSGRNPEELMAGARVEVEEKKRNPMDFALWKAAKPGEPSWDSPWGQGRPGWHIECSAMNKAIFGEQIDIHGGGTDLMFPHHENEIAQTEGCTHKTFSKYWIHWQMLNFSGQKMSKSVGNILSMRQFAEKYHPEIYKFMILSIHYRSVADFNEEVIHRAISSLAKVYSALSVADLFLRPSSVALTDSRASESDKLNAAMQVYWDKVMSSLSDDFNMSEVLAIVYEIVKTFNQSVKRGLKENPAVIEKCVQLKLFFQRLHQLTSLFGEDANTFLKFLDDKLIQIYQIDVSVVQSLVEERKKARAEKNFALSDQLRDRLNQMKIAISDTSDGMHWEVMK